MHRAGRPEPRWRQRIAASLIAGLVIASANSGISMARSDAGANGVLDAIAQAQADQEAAALAAAEEAAALAAAAATVEEVAPAPTEGEVAPVEEEIVAEQAAAPADEEIVAEQPVAEATDLPGEGAMALAEAAAAPDFAQQAAAAALPEGLDAATILGVEAAPVLEPVAEAETLSPAVDEAAAGNGGAAEAGGDAGTVRNAQAVEAAQPAAGQERGGVVGLRNRLLGVETETTGGVAVGNGGTSNASADGGYVIIDEIATGDNSGNTINVYDCGYGSAAIDGGSVVNETTFDISAGGGNSITIAPGGDTNFTGTAPRDGVTGGVIRNGNGGIASGGADGGWIVINEFDAGGNTGNTINNECGEGTGNVGDGTLSIDGGTVSNITHVTISADGGTAIADGSGGSDNAGFLAGGLAADEAGRQRGVVGLRNELLGIGGGAVGGILAVGNGGTARATADGGLVLIDSINTGGNTGNTINVGTPPEDASVFGEGGVFGFGRGGDDDKKSSGGGGSCIPSDLSINGGTVSSATDLTISADGGTAIADGSGGDGNFGFGGGTGILALGNGGTADATANGGFVQIDDITTGGNVGNTVSVAGIGCTQLAPAAPEKPTKPEKEKPGKPTVGSSAGEKAGVRVVKAPASTPARAQAPTARGGQGVVARGGQGAAKSVKALPSTGSGDGLVLAHGATTVAWLAAWLLPLLALGFARRQATVRS